MIALLVMLALTSTTHHVAVVPTDSDAAPTQLEQRVRDALKAASPNDMIQTRADLIGEVTSEVHLGSATPKEADQACGLVCAFGRDGLVTFERLVIDGKVFLKLAVFRPDEATPLGQIVMPMEQTQAAAVQAVRLLSSSR